MRPGSAGSKQAAEVARSGAIGGDAEEQSRPVTRGTIRPPTRAASSAKASASVAVRIQALQGRTAAAGCTAEPSATGRGTASRTTIRSAQPVGLVQVCWVRGRRSPMLGESGVMTSHMDSRLRGSRPVWSTLASRKIAEPGSDEAGTARSGFGAAKAARVGVEPGGGLASVSSNLVQSDSPARRVAAAAEAGARVAIMRRFCSPVCNSSTAACWPVRLMLRRTRLRCRGGSSKTGDRG